MNEASHRDLKLLVRRRWDPRVGMGKNQGRFEWALGTLMVLFLFVGFFVPSSAPLWLRLLPTGLFYLMCFMLAGSWICTRVFTRKRIEYRVKKHDGFICVWCSYPFTGLGDEGHCPECGAGYTKELCQRLFGLAYRKFTPSPQEFGRRESLAWRKAIQLRDHPELVNPSTPEPIILDEDETGRTEFSPTKEQRYEIDRLALRRLDPRKGVGPVMGWIKHISLVLSIVLFFVVMYGIIPASNSHGIDALKWIPIYLVPFLIFLICWLIPMNIRQRTAQTARKHGFKLCPWCRHGLSHLAEMGKCPKCDKKYQRWACVLLYENAYRGFRPTKEELRERERKGWAEAVRVRDQES